MVTPLLETLSGPSQVYSQNPKRENPVLIKWCQSNTPLEKKTGDFRLCPGVGGAGVREGREDYGTLPLTVLTRDLTGDITRWL